ncbi:type II secretion system protein [Lachnospiraceae bacterium HCP1S3_C3]|nr:type II secretion system GspH family protein [Lachnospiraceae bacterium]
MEKNKNSGFSLIELIIVIAIMAVLVALIAPNMTKYLSKSKRNTDLHNAGELADMIQVCINDYEVEHGEFIKTGGGNVTLSWSGKNVSGGPASFNDMLDGMVTKDPTSEETGTVATASIALKGSSSRDGYKVTVTIGNANVVK